MSGTDGGRPPLSVRQATDEDAPALVALVNAAFVIERAFADRDRTTLDEIRGLLQKGTFLIVDGPDGTPAACVYLEQRGYRAYLGMLAVDPSHQRTGLGRQMMDAAESYCRKRRVRSLDIRILSLRTELPKFYRHLGFVEEGTAPFEDPKVLRPAHFILMSKNLS